jgi:hypothetical protein
MLVFVQRQVTPTISPVVVVAIHLVAHTVTAATAPGNAAAAARVPGALPGLPPSGSIVPPAGERIPAIPARAAPQAERRTVTIPPRVTLLVTDACPIVILVTIAGPALAVQCHIIPAAGAAAVVQVRRGADTNMQDEFSSC